MLAVYDESLVPLGWLVLGNTVGVCDVRTGHSDTTMSFRSFTAHPLA